MTIAPRDRPPRPRPTDDGCHFVESDCSRYVVILWYILYSSLMTILHAHLLHGRTAAPTAKRVRS